MMRSAQILKQAEKWDSEDLLQRLCHALDIAELAINELLPDGYAHASTPGLEIRAEKVISEIAVLLIACSSARKYSEVDRRIRRLAEGLIPHARSKRMMLGMCLEPTVVWDYALAHVCLSRLGYLDLEFDHLLHHCLDAQACHGRERVPHRSLEQDWIAKMWSGATRPTRFSMRSTARSSILNHPVDLLSSTREDIYALTHALMYVTDFNLHPAPLPRRRSALLGDCEAILARCLDDQDYDLAGEVSLAWPLTGSTWSATSAFAFRVLAGVEDRASFLPTASTRISELSALHGRDKARYLAATAYHTAFVMGLLCAASLQPGYEPPKQIPVGAKVARGAANRVLPLLANGAQMPHWMEEFLQLSPREADALTGFLLHVGMRRRVRDRDFAGLRDMVELACDLGLDASSAVIQAAEMLHRLAEFNKLSSRDLNMRPSPAEEYPCKIEKKPNHSEAVLLG